MTRLVQNRWIGRLLLAVYALSTVATSSFHNHEHGHQHDHGHSLGLSCSHADHSGGEIACLDHHDSDAIAEHESASHEGVGQHQTSVQNSEQSSDDACVVCRFLGLSSLPIVLPPLPANAELVATINAVEPRHAALPLALTLHSRAPPQVV